MNLETFENQQVEQPTSEADTSFVQSEASSLRNKIEKRKAKQQKLKTIVIVLTVLIILLATGFGYSQYKLYRLSEDEKVSENTAAVAPKTGEEVVKALSRHILLPSGAPQIAEVKEIEKLRSSSPFFKNAENGDIVVVYETTIFVYRPTKDIVVASGDVSGVGQTKP